jgi:hypothetical protein
MYLVNMEWDGISVLQGHQMCVTFQFKNTVVPILIKMH